MRQVRWRIDWTARPGRRFALTLAFTAAGLYACEDAVMTGPGPTPPPPTTTSIPPPVPPRADEFPMLGSNIAGFTAFSLVETYDPSGYETLADFERQYIVRMLKYMRSRGYNTARVGAQTDGWCGSGVFYLPCGTTPFTPQWRENLIGFLELSARVEGMWVQLIPTFTHKGDKCGQSCLVELTKAVVKIVQDGGYKHIIWEAFNEFNHPLTNKAGNLHTSVLRAVLNALPHPRGTDVPGNHVSGDGWRGNPDHATFSLVIHLMDYIAYHPSRNPEPTELAYTRTIFRSRGKPVLFDETVSWITEAEAAMLGRDRNKRLFTQGTQEEMDRQVRRQVDTICRAGGAYFFHALWLFSYDQRLDFAPMVNC